MEPNRLIALSFLIISIIAVTAIHCCLPQPGGPQTGKPQIAKVQIKGIDVALQLFRYDTGRYPTTAEGLKALLQNHGLKSWRGPYTAGQEKPEIPSDPWGRPYVYRCPGDHESYDLLSYGRDGIPGGEGEAADITTTTPR